MEKSKCFQWDIIYENRKIIQNTTLLFKYVNKNVERD